MSTEVGDDAHFLMVYIREAHASDEWQMLDNAHDSVSVVQPITQYDRNNVASECGSRMEISFPLVVDDMDDTVNKLYGAWPERLYVIAADGTVAYQGDYGPFGFDPDGMRDVLMRQIAADDTGLAP